MAAIYSPETITDLSKIVARLPQVKAGVVDMKNLERWVTRLAHRGIPAAELLWHAVRAGGIGGSDIGQLCEADKGHFTFSTPQEIIKQKLFMLPPDNETGAMVRGTGLEEHVRVTYINKLIGMGHDVKRRPDIMDAIFNTKLADHPWLRSSLDDVLEIDGRLKLIDYKAPSEKVLADYIRNADHYAYDVQLHQYDLNAAAIDGLELDPDFRLVFFDYANNDVVEHIVERSEEVQQHLLTVGDATWNNHVMTGTIPERVFPTIVDPADGIPDHIMRSTERYVGFKQVAKEATEQADIEKMAMTEWVRSVGQLGATKLPLLDMVGLSASKIDINITKAIKHMAEIGVPEEEIEACRETIMPAKGTLETLYKRVSKTIEEIKTKRDEKPLEKPSGKDYNEVIEQLEALESKIPAMRLGDYMPEKIAELLTEYGLDPNDYKEEELEVRLMTSKLGKEARMEPEQFFSSTFKSSFGVADAEEELKQNAELAF